MSSTDQVPDDFQLAMEDFEIVDETATTDQDPPPPYSPPPSPPPQSAPVPSTSTSNKGPLELPSNCAELHELYKSDPEACKSIYGLTQNGLTNGRSFNSIMMMVVGESNSGKSTTINKLFNDPNLCPTNKFKSETKQISIYEKRLLVRETNPQVYGYIRFIDTPGTFDSEGKDTDNLNLLKQFRTQSAYLSSADRNRGYGVLRRTLSLSTRINIRNTVYPNIVLFFLSADAKNKGSSTRLRTSLQVLKQSGFLDTKYPNLVVVVTRAAQLIDTNDEDEDDEYFKKQSYIINSSALKHIINATIQEVFEGDLKPEVVFVENKHFGELKKQTDYYQLPDGDLSHYNLLCAIQNCLGKHQSFNDVLGKLLIGCYLDPSCAERKDAPTNKIVFSPSEEFEIVQQAEEGVDVLSLEEFKRYVALTEKFYFQFLGRGLCKRSCEVKLTSLLDSHEFKNILFGNKEVLVPESLQVFHQPSTVIFRWELNTDALGSKLMSNLMKKFNLEFAAGAQVYAYQFERILSLVKLDNPESILDNCDAFKEAIEKLEESETCSSGFANFFERWGTHLITQQAVGGGIYVFFTLDKELPELGDLEGHTDFIQRIKEMGVQNERIILLGGNLDSSVFNFESLSNDVLRTWEESVLEEPANLVSEIQFFPFYQLLSHGNAQSTFKQATNAYVISKNEICQTIPTPSAQQTVAQEEPLQNSEQTALPEPGKNVEKKQLTRKIVAEEMKSNAIQYSEKKKDDSAGCFPAGTTVYVYNGLNSGFEEKPIEQLALGDQVSAVQLKSGSTGKLTTSRMCDFLHNATDRNMEYLVLSFENGHELVVSELHVIFINEEGCLKALKAKDVVVGDSLTFCSPDQKVQVTKCMKICRKECIGVYAPLTTSGTFFANGFLVTSYADVDSFEVAQVAMAPLKMWAHSKSLFLNGRKTNRNCELVSLDNIHPYAKFLMKVRHFCRSKTA